MCFSWILLEIHRLYFRLIYMRPRTFERVQGRQSNLLEAAWLLASDPRKPKAIPWTVRWADARAATGTGSAGVAPQ